MKYFHALIILGFFSFCTAQTFYPVSVSVYYSIYCENCRAFFTAKFAPYYEGLKTWIDLDLIPFGNSTHEDGGNFEFTCPEGPDECIANKWHACASWLYSGTYPTELANFVNCTLWRDDRFFENIEQCAKKFYLDFLPIQFCVNGYEGSMHLAANAARTNARDPPINSFPSIVFNGTYDQELQDLAVMDFQEAICSLIRDKTTGAQPEGCNSGLALFPAYGVLLLALGILIRA